ncbi:ABC transporter permease [Streptomyces sp. NPDC048737]|uniref:ABC transporter permease n=1 Tax=unclassified Streptomyces TaxID=2593676 RepID=UPI003418DC84
MSTVVMARMGALGRAELTLLLRAKSALFMGLASPVLLTVGLWSAVKEMDLSRTGLSPGTVLLPGAMGFVLLFAVYANLVGVYVVRREELVLKRLRTGEASDPEILAGSALPAVAITVLQCGVLVVGGAALLGLSMPSRPDLLIAGLLLGTVMTASMAAASSVITRSAEAAQVTPLPVMLVSLMGSGMFIPLDVMPERLATVCEFLPLSPVMALLRAGWVGGVGAGETLRFLALALVWTGLSLLAVRRWFRWEPRG